MFGYNSTINRKMRACKNCNKLSYIFSKGRCADCARVEDTQTRMAIESERIIKEDNLADIISDADFVFSRYIRLKYADDSGNGWCFTCVSARHWSMLQCGHFIKRAHLFLRFDERNCRPQCIDCNERKDGNIREFSKKLEAEKPGITEILFEESRLVYKPTRAEIIAVISEYTPKVKELLKKIKK